MIRIKIIMLFCFIAIGQTFGQTSSLNRLILSNGNSLEKELAKYLDLAVSEYDKNYDKYLHHTVFIEILVDKNGKAILDRADYRRGKLLEDKVKQFIELQTFDVTSISDEIETQRFTGWISFMNKDKKEARKERRQEILEEKEAHKKRLVADSINGLYIPRNIEECFIELNKILELEDIESIKNLKDRNETISFHHGLGMWLRNNWGLWGGSRLQQYLSKKGIKHPDNMSASILEFYYDWLNGQHNEWRRFKDK